MSFDYTFSNSISLTGGGGGSGGLQGALGINGVATKNAATNSVVPIFAMSGGGTSGPKTFNASVSSASPITFDSPLSTFEGAGQFTFDWLAIASYGGSPTTFLDSLDRQAPSSVTATFTYIPVAPVPEPSTCIFGLVGLAAGFRRIRRSTLQ